MDSEGKTNKIAQFENQLLQAQYCCLLRNSQTVQNKEQK